MAAGDMSGGSGGSGGFNGLRDTNFGINYNQGFQGAPQGFMPDTNSPLQQMLAGQGAYNQQALLKRQQQGQQALATTQGQFGTEQAQISAAAQELPAQLQQQRFNTLLPWVQGQFQAANNPAAASSAQPPEISVGPVWNPQQIQQQVNASRASTDATTANQMQQDQQSAAGRGFGGNSPLLQQLRAQRQMSGNQQNAQSDQQIRWNAAQGNAQQTLASQQARAQQFSTQQEQAIERSKNANVLLQALLGTI